MMKLSKRSQQRLPLYLDYLRTYSKERISSKALAEALGLGELTVRKDLASVSKGGRCRIGHGCQQLIADLERSVCLVSI